MLEIYPKLLAKKKIKTRYEVIEVVNEHPLAVRSGNFGISPYLQELLCYVGQDDIYEAGSESIEKLLRIQMNKKQVERVSKYHSEQVSDDLLTIAKNDLPQAVQEDEKIYVMMDGSMILTREDTSEGIDSKEESEWKEVKLARIFSSKSMYSLSPKRNWIKDSIYVGHLGKHTDFLAKLSPHTDQYDQKMIFINDGASWIWNWIEANYPSAVQILDYYHAVEYLAEFAQNRFSQKTEQKQWREQQEQLLWENRIGQVITNIEAFEVKSEKQKKAKQKILTYYKNHAKRMTYGTFREQGYLVGSGPIESAHRTVVQKRMKCSGQRWTKEGAQKILDLRIAHLNKQWHKVIQSVSGKLVA